VAVVRADLYDRSLRRPAAWAVAEARFNGRTIARGMSDMNGRLALVFAYPEPQASWASPPAEVTSPAVPLMAPLAEQRWLLDLAVRYDRTAPVRTVPDLCEALAQAPAQCLADASPESLPVTGIALRYGEATVIRTANTSGEERGCLLITTGGSPL
jgi:hypothetical protein